MLARCLYPFFRLSNPYLYSLLLCLYSYSPRDAFYPQPFLFLFPVVCLSFELSPGFIPPSLYSAPTTASKQSYPRRSPTLSAPMFPKQVIKDVVVPTSAFSHFFCAATHIKQDYPQLPTTYIHSSIRFLENYLLTLPVLASILEKITIFLLMQLSMWSPPACHLYHPSSSLSCSRWQARQSATWFFLFFFVLLMWYVVMV